MHLFRGRDVHGVEADSLGSTPDNDNYDDHNGDDDD